MERKNVKLGMIVLLAGMLLVAMVAVNGCKKSTPAEPAGKAATDAGKAATEAGKAATQAGKTATETSKTATEASKTATTEIGRAHV